MKGLPTIQPELAPSCALDAEGLRAQAKRYRRAGEGAELLERTRRRIALRVREGADLGEVSEAVAIERECCPFYAISWDPGTRELAFAVERAEHEPALAAIAFALGVDRAGDV